MEISAFVYMLLLGFTVSVMLAMASKIFYVKEDPKIEAILSALPGFNCGSCGLAGCREAAKAVACGDVLPDVCRASDFDVTRSIGLIMGLDVREKEPEFAFTSCIYGTDKADLNFIYSGISDCNAELLLNGGSKKCNIGCLGLGSCVKACNFGAISIGKDNLPFVNRKKCTGCGACETACPKNIITMTSTSKRIVSEFNVNECTSPCERSCPTGINIRAFIKSIKNQDYEKAYLIIREKCPLPLICGHICPAPCEIECSRNQLDESVSINNLKRFVSDYEMKTGVKSKPYKMKSNNTRVAVIGGGSEGLTIAFYLSSLGYEPSIFEARSKLGGILRYVISKDRLPEYVLDHEIKNILEMGILSKTQSVMGQDFTLESLLKEGFDSIIITSGGYDSRKILLPKRKCFFSPFNGFKIMIDLLNDIETGEKIEPAKQVVIVHGGVGAIEIADRYLKEGTQKVFIICRNQLDKLPSELQNNFVLAKRDIDVIPSAIITKIEGENNSIRRVVISSTDDDDFEDIVIETDQLVASTGRIPEFVFVPVENEDSRLLWETVEVFKTYPGGGCSGVFSTPEPGRVSDSFSVVKSILSGRRIARGVNQYYMQNAVFSVTDLICDTRCEIDIPELSNVEKTERVRAGILDVGEDTGDSWLATHEILGIDEERAQIEAGRCLQCGLTCFRKDSI
jgi:NADPH-dependent glutamate synthase beta subunit-like oxidoreductase